MDAQNLIAAIAACMNPDVTIRKAGEDALKQQPNYPGGLPSLLAVALEDAAELGVRQVAAIALKNAVKKDWEDRAVYRPNPSPFSEADKASVRDHLFDGVCRAPSTVRKQLEECIKVIVNSDYPEHWPSLLPAIQASLSSPDVTIVAGCLRTLRLVVRKYEFVDESDRAPLLATVDATFPTVLAVFQTLVANPDPSLDLAEMLKLCCKIFWSTCFMEIPPLITQDAQFSGWMAALLALANRPVPRDQMPQDTDARTKWPWWKAKKWVYNIFNRLLQRYGDPKTCTSPSDVAFATRWQSACSGLFLAAVLQELSAIARGEYIAERVANNLLNFLSTVVSQGSMWKDLKPHAQDIVVHGVLPLMAFTDEDAELWHEDPHEYVRKGYDVIEDIYSSKTAAMGLLHSLCSARKKTQLDPTMAHIVGILNEARDAIAASGGTGAMPEQMARRLDGALLAIGSLDSSLKKEARYRAQLDPMLLGHIVPLFASPHGHLRAKAIWLAGIFADAKFAEGRGRGATFTTLLQGVVAALGDRELPVRVDAAVAVRDFLHALEDEDLGPLRPLVPDLLKRFLELSQEVPAEDITESLQTLVERFGSDLAPYAVNVMNALVQQFWHAVSAAGDDDGDGDLDEDGFSTGGALSGYSLLSAMETVLDAVSSVPELYLQMEEVLFPILERFTSDDGLDVFEEVTGIVTFLTYWSPGGISPRMWTIYPRLLQCITTWGRDYWEDVLPPLDNYISRGTDTFLSCADPPLLALTNQAIEHGLGIKPSTAPAATTATDDAESDLSFAAIEATTCSAQLISVILHNCRGRVDHCIAPYLTLLTQQIVTEGSLKGGKKQYDAILQAVSDCFYYNAGITLTITSQAGTLQALLTSLTRASTETTKNGNMRHFASKRAKKIISLGLIAILGAPAASMPPVLSQNLGEVAAAAMHVLLALKQQEESAGPRYESETDNDDDEDASDSGSDGLGKFSQTPAADDDDDDDDDAGEDILVRRARAAARAAAQLEADDGDIDSDDIDWWSEDDDDGIQSPIDEVSPYVFFAETLQTVQAEDPARFAAVTSKMDAGTQAAAQAMMEFAVQLRQAHAEAAAAADAQRP